MLVLTRHVGETVRIGDDISLTVLGVKGGRVRLGVHAPRDVVVNRAEIHQKISAEAGDAASPLEGASQQTDEADSQEGAPRDRPRPR